MPHFKLVLDCYASHLILMVGHLVEYIGIIFTFLAVQVDPQALNSMQDQRHTDEYHNYGEDEDDEDYEDNFIPVYSVGIDNGLEHNSFLETIVSLANGYHRQ